MMDDIYIDFFLYLIEIHQVNTNRKLH